MNSLDAWIERQFAGYGRAIRAKDDPPLADEPYMSMADAKMLTRRAVAEYATWQSIETMPPEFKDGREVLLAVKMRAGVPNGCLVGHYMRGGHCIEDHPPIEAGWYFWNGCMFDKAAEPTLWRPLLAPLAPSAGHANRR